MSLLTFSRSGSGIRADAIAGITVGMVLVPQAMAYASLAGMPPVYGLYAATIPVVIGACFGHCPILNTGPVAMTSLLTLAALTPLATEGSAEYIALAALLALLVGAVRVLAGFCKGSFLVDIISHPVMTGFSAAAGITIASTQIPKMFGVNPGKANPVWNSICAMMDWGHIHYPSLALGVGSLLAMFLLKKYTPRLPNILLVLIVATFGSWYWDFASIGGQVVGEIPSGLPSIALPENVWQHSITLLPSAVLVAIIGLLEVMTVTSSFKAQTGRDTDIDKELIGQGLASAAAGCCSGFPVSGSLSRSSLTMVAQAQTGLSAIFSALVVIATLLFATPLLRPLPMAALAAAIVMAVIALIRIGDFKRCWHIRKRDGCVALWTLVITIALAPDMVIGMGAGIGLSVLFFTIEMMRPRLTVLKKDAEGAWKGTDDIPTNGILHIRFDGRLSFLNGRSFVLRIQNIVAQMETCEAVLIESNGINGIDTTGIDHINALRAGLERRNISLNITIPKKQVIETLFQAGCENLIHHDPDACHNSHIKPEPKH